MLRVLAALAALAGFLCLFVLACGGGDAAMRPAAPVAHVATGAKVAEPDPEPVNFVPDGDPGPIPVTSADPIRGRVDAPVTIVEFADFQCPYCARVEGTLALVLQTYGPSKVRIVWKNNPLPFHPKARPTGAAAMALFEQRGPDAFWRAHDAFFGDQQHLDETLEDVARLAGAKGAEQLKGTALWTHGEAKVDADAALGSTIGVSGIPAFYINGVSVVGAQPFEKFAAVIDAELARADEALARGVPKTRLYGELAKVAFKSAPPPEPSKPPPPPDTTPRRVPIGSSPIRGKAAALVTLVAFSEFQCPFCGRVTPTLRDLSAMYGDRLRIVWKNNPLPFHPHAEPAAELALEARAQRGDRGFWAAHDLLFAKECKGATATSRQACMDAGGTWEDHQAHLEEPDLKAYATALGLDVGRVMTAIRQKRYAAIISEDQDLAEDLSASGTPTFFVNGRRLVGAQPIEKFKEIIDAELAHADELVKSGTPAARVYERIQAAALVAEVQLEKKSVPLPTAANPSRGPANAKVVIQMFADFQCPFCSRAAPVMEELERAYPGKIRLVWRHLPLPFHQNAQAASEAAMEAFKQRGAAGFWAMYAILYKNQTALDRASLDGYAAQAGLDVPRFAAAVDGRVHQAAVDADAKLATDVGISGTPTFLINGYVVNGAQPLKAFRRAVERALADTH